MASFNQISRLTQALLLLVLSMQQCVFAPSPPTNGLPSVVGSVEVNASDIFNEHQGQQQSEQVQDFPAQISTDLETGAKTEEQNTNHSELEQDRRREQVEKSQDSTSKRTENQNQVVPNSTSTSGTDASETKDAVIKTGPLDDQRREEKLESASNKETIGANESEQPMYKVYKAEDYPIIRSATYKEVHHSPDGSPTRIKTRLSWFNEDGRNAMITRKLQTPMSVPRNVEVGNIFDQLMELRSKFSLNDLTDVKGSNINGSTGQSAVANTDGHACSGVRKIISPSFRRRFPFKLTFPKYLYAVEK